MVTSVAAEHMIGSGGQCAVLRERADMLTYFGQPNLHRRDFLIRTGWVAAGVTVLSSCSWALPVMPELSGPEPEDSLFWLQALSDGRIRFLCPRMEMGQGATTGLTQVVAEELNVTASEIECVVPDTNQVPPFKMTVGSQSILDFFQPTSYGAAQLREALRRRAAEKAGVEIGLVKDDRGGFTVPGGKRLRYGELAGNEPVILTSDQSLPEDSLPRYAHERQGRFHAIGKSWKRRDQKDIVTGRAVYSRDVSVPGMLYGHVLKPPGYGASLLSVDADESRAMPGVVSIVVDKSRDFAGIVVDDPFVLQAAVDAIHAEWQIPEIWQQAQVDAMLDVERLVLDDDFEHTLENSGDIEEGQQAASFRVTARYDTPFAAHVAMEPRAAVAWVRQDKVEIWCGSQAPFFVRGRVARIINRDDEDVVVHPHLMGGAFGGRTACQASEEAAVLSASVGRPVRVQWSREEDFQHNYFRPQYSHYIDAGVTKMGTISHWQHDFVSSPVILSSSIFPSHLHWAVDLIGDFGTSRGAIPPYQIDDKRIRFSDLRIPVPTGTWRGLGAAPNTFAIECMMDELAAAAGADPVEFRIRNLPPKQERLATVLRRVAKMSALGRATPPGTGRGLACTVYKDAAAVAIVAEVRIDKAEGKLYVDKAWCAHDCGLVINPDQVRAQISGNIIWGCGMAFKEQVVIQDSSTDVDNFNGYKIVRNDEAPDIEIALIEPPGSMPVGVGEPAIAPTAAAIANAVFAATGKRFRRLPITYDSVLDALQV